MHRLAIDYFSKERYTISIFIDYVRIVFWFCYASARYYLSYWQEVLDIVIAIVQSSEGNDKIKKERGCL
jgi:hypothetical protein